jgi:hypothetical protein
VGYGQLLIYKNHGTYIFNGTSQYKVSSYGTVSHRSIRNVGQNVFAFHWGTDRKAITMYDGQGIKVISDVIEPVLNVVTSANATASVAGIYEGHYYLYIGDITIPEDWAEYHKLPTTMSKVLVDLDFVHSTPSEPIISLHQLPIAVKCMEEHDGSLYFGSTNGEVYLWDSGYSDDSTPIENIVQTKNYYGTDPDSLKDYEKIIIYMNEGTTSQAMYSIDNSDWKVLGNCNKSFNVFTKYFGTGHGIRIKVTTYSSERPNVFKGFMVEYNPKGVAK